jgi:hypothetical protein
MKSWSVLKVNLQSNNIQEENQILGDSSYGEELENLEFYMTLTFIKELPKTNQLNLV